MNFMKILGTAGARFAVTQQLRKSGGIWLSINDTNILVDPGPGSLIRCLSSKPKLSPSKLDGIILTHKHIDHSNDINIMIEAMTNGGFKKKGVVFAPSDAYDGDPVILKHFRNHVQRTEILTEGAEYEIGNIKFSTPVRHIHDVETYGLNFFNEDKMVSLIADTKYFEDIEKFYTGDVLILNVVLRNHREEIAHLCLDDAEKIIKENKPRLSILTHFGMTMIKDNPWELANHLSAKLGVKVIAASDGMQINLDEI